MSLHGLRRGDEVIHVTHIPGRKKPVLLIGNGLCSQKIATFDSEEDAENFIKLLDRWLGIEESEEDL